MKHLFTPAASRHRRTYRGVRSNPGEFPHVVQVWVGSNRCTGVLIGSRTVLSAGRLRTGETHCLPARGFKVQVESAGWNMGQSAVVLDRHPMLDLGIACLGRPSTPAIRRFAMLPSSEVVPDTDEVRTVGFGETRLQTLNRECTRPMMPIYGDSQIVRNTVGQVSFAVVGGKTPCSGDSGGPAFVKGSDILAGIVAGYDSVYQRGSPVRVTRVDTSDVLEWIRAAKHRCES